MQTSTEMRVWIGCLACYNDGNLRGDWHDACDAGGVTTDDIHGGPSSHEELWCMESEGFPAGSGEMSPQEAQDMAEAFERVQEPAAFAAWIAHGCGTVDDGREFESAYQGEYQSEEDFAEELAEETGAVKDGGTWPNNCIDWERAWRELEMGGDYFSACASGGAVYVFSTR